MLNRVIKNIEEYDVDVIECPTLRNLDNVKLKTNNVIINLFDVMDFKNEELPLIQKLFPNKNILVITPHKYGDDVEYQDGTVATLEQEVIDVVTFLTWTAMPELEKRKSSGIKVIIFLLIMTFFFFLSYKKIWKDVK